MIVDFSGVKYEGATVCVCFFNVCLKEVPCKKPGGVSWWILFHYFAIVFFSLAEDLINM